MKVQFFKGVNLRGRWFQLNVGKQTFMLYTGYPWQLNAFSSSPRHGLIGLGPFLLSTYTT
jgi:hypothetical protein